MFNHTQGIPDAFARFIMNESTVDSITTKESGTEVYRRYLNEIETTSLQETFMNISNRLGYLISLTERRIELKAGGSRINEDQPTILAQINTAIYELLYLLSAYSRLIGNNFEDVIDQELHTLIRHDCACVYQLHRRIISETDGYGIRYYCLRNEFVIGNLQYFFTYMFQLFPNKISE